MSNYITATIFLVIGLFFKYHSSTLPLGSLSNIGPGYFPNLVSTILIIVGLIILVKQLTWKS